MENERLIKEYKEGTIVSFPNGNVTIPSGMTVIEKLSPYGFGAYLIEIKENKKEKHSYVFLYNVSPVFIFDPAENPNKTLDDEIAEVREEHWRFLFSNSYKEKNEK